MVCGESLYEVDCDLCIQYVVEGGDLVWQVIDGVGQCLEFTVRGCAMKVIGDKYLECIVVVEDGGVCYGVLFTGCIAGTVCCDIGAFGEEKICCWVDGVDGMVTM